MVIDQTEMTPLAFERNVRDVQVTLAGIAQRQNPLFAVAAFDAAKHGRAGYRFTALALRPQEAELGGAS